METEQGSWPEGPVIGLGALDHLGQHTEDGRHAWQHDCTVML